MTREPPSGPDHDGSFPDEAIPEPYRLSTYNYDLPQSLIAQEPAAKRDHARLLIIRRGSGEISHRAFRELPSILSPDDLLVLNETKVVPAFLVCRKPTGGRVELLVVSPARASEPNDDGSTTTRACLARASKSLKKGGLLTLEDGTDLEVAGTVGPGKVLIRFPTPEEHLTAFLETHGHPPLPPYIRRETRDEHRDTVRYQTVYASAAGSVAAPTAGLHFTDGLLNELAGVGIEIARIVLHVGPGTFSPIRTEDIRLHRMESEYYEISEESAEAVERARAENRRIVAVGSTSVRTLEAAAARDGIVRAGRGETNLFITPGHGFRVVGAMLTNFHLPRSTLLVLVGAFAGTDRIKAAYIAAVDAGYRFYSYGDAGLILD